MYLCVCIPDVNKMYCFSVYLRSSPEVVFKRMQRRNRPEERTVQLQYLTDLHTYYEDWLMKENSSNIPCPLLVLDVSEDMSDNQLMEVYKSYEDQILGKVPTN